MAEVFFTAFLFAFLISAISFRFGLLTFSGSAAALILGTIIFALGKLQFSFPLLLFFSSSSFLSKLRFARNKEVETYFEKTGTRDYKQVIANGLVPALIVCLKSLYHDHIYFLLYTSSIAAVCADTWGTEIGTMRKAVTYNILNFKRTEQGTSGGISVLGTFGSLIGAAVISFSSFLWIEFDIGIFIFVIASGFVAAIIDSILGASVQIQYKCSECGKVVEKEKHCGTSTIRERGFYFFTNDVVNLICSISGALILIVIYNLFL